MNAWWLVCKKELRETWIGGKALVFIIGYTILLSAYTYWTVKSSTTNFVPPKEMVFELAKLVMMVAVFMGLILGADSLSGERERATLEALLLTPASRRQIVVGKFLAALSPWPIAMGIAIPYMRVLAQGDEVFGPAVLWAAVLGTMLTPAFTALGMVVSFWCANNKTSMFISLVVYLLFLLPTQLPGHAQGGFMGLLFQQANPMAAPRVFLASLLVNNRTFEEMRSWLLSPALFAVFTFVLLFWYAGPGLRLEPGKAGRLEMARGRAMSMIGIVLFVGLLRTTSLAAQAPAGAQEPAPAAVLTPAAASSLGVTVDIDARVVQAGATVLYNTVLTNNGMEPTPALIAAMNIINLDKQGEVVDPEDWSPQRTQYVDRLAPGQSVSLAWRVNAILDGDYMVYTVAIPAPAGRETTSQPVASSGIHLTVTPFTKLNPGGVLPYAIGGPLVLGLVIFLVYRHRRRQIDAGGTQ